jgi:hypothetical protein
LAIETDLDQVVDELRHRFPGICLWWGEYTGSLWAMLSGQLIESKNASELARRIHTMIEQSCRQKAEDRGTKREHLPPRARDGAWDLPSKQRLPVATPSGPTHVATGRQRDGFLSRF